MLDGYVRLIPLTCHVDERGSLTPIYLADAGLIPVRSFFVTALAGAVRRFAGQPLEAQGIGAPLDWDGFPQRALLVGRVPDGRALEAGQPCHPQAFMGF